MTNIKAVHIAITHLDGTLSLMQFVTHERAATGELRWQRLATSEAVDAEIERSGLKEVKSWRFIEPSELPSDRTYRNAWRDGGRKKGIGHDMVLARDVHRELLRAARASKLADLDIEYQRADEVGDTAAKAAVAKRKQLLRDVTTDPAITRAKTPEALKAAWPFPDVAISG